MKTKPLVEYMQEMFLVGTKEFNILASTYFVGDSKQEILEKNEPCLNCEWGYDSCPHMDDCLKTTHKVIIPKEEPKQETPTHKYNFCEELKEYINKTPREKILADWEKSAHLDHIGPTVEEFIGHQRYEALNQETLEAAAEKYARTHCDDMYDKESLAGASWGWETSLDFIAGAKWQAKRMYSEKEVELIALEMVSWTLDNIGNKNAISSVKFDEIISKFKKK